MKTKSGYETNGDYIKFKSGFTSNWAVETENEIKHFKTEDEADLHIVTKIIGCEKAYPICKHLIREDMEKRGKNIEKEF